MNQFTNNNTGPSPLAEAVAYTTVSEAVAALTPHDQLWLARLAGRRLRRLRTHAGLARYLAGLEPAELVDEAIARLQAGSRQTKPRHLASHQAFLNHVQSVINSVANNYTRHAEPHLDHVPLGEPQEDSGYVEPPSGDDVRRSVAEREWLQWLFEVIARSASLELQDELARLRKACDLGAPATHLVQGCSARLLGEVQQQVRIAGLEPPTLG